MCFWDFCCIFDPLSNDTKFVHIFWDQDLSDRIWGPGNKFKLPIIPCRCIFRYGCLWFFCCIFYPLSNDTKFIHIFWDRNLGDRMGAWQRINIKLPIILCGCIFRYGCFWVFCCIFDSLSNDTKFVNIFWDQNLGDRWAQFRPFWTRSRRLMRLQPCYTAFSQCIQV